MNHSANFSCRRVDGILSTVRRSCLLQLGQRAARAVFTAGLACLAAASAPPPDVDLTEMSLEELMEVKVVSVSRHEQRLSDSAAAVYVITAEDIRRSGATSIPEALRMAPGVQVARVDANKWAIGVRGFNSRFSSKLLVMIDGRSVYNPLFSGVYWEVQDALLEDVERIEVVRGPGGSVWGSNAVNGVINIITKHARDTQGGILTAGGGNQESAIGGIRYGGRAGPNVHYRVFSKYFDRRGHLQPSGERAPDDWDVARGGFRVDWERSPQDTFLFSGDTYEGDAGGRLSVAAFEPPLRRTVRDPVSLSGANIMGRWTRRHSEASHSTLQVYFDRYRREEFSPSSQLVRTLDFDFQNETQLGDRFRLLWGLGYRTNWDELRGSEISSFTPEERRTHLTNAYFQQDVWLVPGKLQLAFGSKFEWNSYTQWETQPSASLLWRRSDRTSAWVSVSRAVRIPARADHDFRLAFQSFATPDGGLNTVTFFGDSGFEAEELIAYEAGYRVRLGQKVSLDLAAFYNDYDDLQATQPGTPFADPSLPGNPRIIPMRLANARSGTAHGGEIALTWRARERTRVHASYSWNELRTSSDFPGGSLIPNTTDDRAPDHQFHARWYQDLPAGLEFDGAYYFVSSLGSLGVPSYHRADLRFGWRPSRRWSFSLAAQNLLDPQHPEMVPLGLEIPSEAGRSVYGKITFGF